MSHLPVLIVGAGPTGLMMACELAHHNVPFRIIDKKSEPTQGANATWIQARTLEIFDAIGIADRFLKKGHHCDAINFYAKGKQLVNIPLNEIDSPYPFILMLPQSETERLLNERLEKSKVRVERSLELIDIKQTNNGVASIVRLANGDIENIASDWVIACDGANSTVRNKCQITFQGEDLPEQFMVADAQMSSFLPNNEIHVFFDKGTIFPEKGTLFSAFPWGANKYRLSANLYLDHARQTFTEKEVREVVAERTYGNYIVENVSWISPFWIHSKIVNNMQNNSIFLLGDAAHIHSPAGGQGMNTGIQDAFNFAWKLALVIQHKAKPIILESFQSERYPIVKNIVKETNSLTNMMLFDKKFFHELHAFSKTLVKKGKTKKIAEELMQLAICYKNSPIIDYSGDTPKSSPKQGQRAPDLKINESENLYHYFSGKHNILLFTGKEKNISADLINFLQKLKMKFSDIANVFLISKENREEDTVILDVNYQIHDKYHITKPALYIIRPDTYICYFSEEPNIKNIESFFNEYLTNV